MDLGATPDDAYFVGDSTIDVEASYHAGVCSIGAGWGVRNFEELSSAAPDVLVLRPDGLLRLDELDRRGYLAEVVCSGATPKVHRGAILPCGESPRRFALGRYFTRSDPRHAASALAATILQLKNSDTPAPLFARALAAFVHECGWTPDYVVPVPPKPSQDRNRFAAVIEEAEPLLPDDIAFVLDGLSCVREVTDYKTLSPPERAAAARGTFTSSYDWRGDKVLLLDDVLTTGETLAECTRVFAATGAAEVRAVVFGKDQQTFATKTCPECERPMRVRTNGYTGERFWGCSGYPDHCQNTENM